MTFTWGGRKATHLASRSTLGKSISADDIGGDDYRVQRRTLPTQIHANGYSVTVRDGKAYNDRGDEVNIDDLPDELANTVRSHL